MTRRCRNNGAHTQYGRPGVRHGVLTTCLTPRDTLDRMLPPIHLFIDKPGSCQPSGREEVTKEACQGRRVSQDLSTEVALTRGGHEGCQHAECEVELPGVDPGGVVAPDAGLWILEERAVASLAGAIRRGRERPAHWTQATTQARRTAPPKGRAERSSPVGQHVHRVGLLSQANLAGEVHSVQDILEPLVVTNLVEQRKARRIEHHGSIGPETAL